MGKHCLSMQVMISHLHFVISISLSSFSSKVLICFALEILFQAISPAIFHSLSILSSSPLVEMTTGGTNSALAFIHIALTPFATSLVLLSLSAYFNHLLLL